MATRSVHSFSRASAIRRVVIPMTTTVPSTSTAASAVRTQLAA
jgi:hypothetical protein